MPSLKYVSRNLYVNVRYDVKTGEQSPRSSEMYHRLRYLHRASYWYIIAGENWTFSRRSSFLLLVVRDDSALRFCSERRSIRWVIASRICVMIKTNPPIMIDISRYTGHTIQTYYSTYKWFAVTGAVNSKPTPLRNHHPPPTTRYCYIENELLPAVLSYPVSVKDGIKWLPLIDVNIVVLVTRQRSVCWRCILMFVLKQSNIKCLLIFYWFCVIFENRVCGGCVEWGM